MASISAGIFRPVREQRGRPAREQVVGEVPIQADLRFLEWFREKQCHS